MIRQAIRPARTICAVLLLTVAACKGVLDVPREGIVTEESLGGAASVNAMRLGVLTSMNGLTGGTTGGAANTATNGDFWTVLGLFADEWRSSNSSLNQLHLTDLRSPVTTQMNASYNTIHDVRYRVYQALPQIRQFIPNQQVYLGQMYFVLGLMETYLGENFCNGTPLSRVANGQVEYGPPLSNKQVLDSAVVHFDSALVYLPGTVAGATELRRAALIMRARAMMDADGSGAAAATAVASVDSIYANSPTFVYAHTYATNQLSNSNYLINISNNGGSMQVEDTIGSNGSPRGAAVGFASANDPRVPVTGTTLGTTPPSFGPATGHDGLPAVRQLLWTQFSRNYVVSALDARLMAAEADLRAGDFVGMTQKLNGLRATAYPLSQNVTYEAGALPPLDVPTTQAEAARLYFYEKGFWTFGRGQRLNDLRRMLRQYGAAYGFNNDNDVFPSGIHHASSAPFLNAVNFPIPDAERINPNVVGDGTTMCTDRLP